MVGTDRSGVLTAPTTLNQVQQLQNVVYHSGNVATPKLLTYEARALDIEDQDYIAIGVTTTSRYAIWLGNSGPIGGTGNVGQYSIEFAVEFKGSR
jgi:hypothetical protein